VQSDKSRGYHGIEATTSNAIRGRYDREGDDPHRQTMVDLQYFVQELRDDGHKLGIFMDANQKE
jgi:hypothetical protein